MKTQDKDKPNTQAATNRLVDHIKYYPGIYIEVPGSDTQRRQTFRHAKLILHGITTKDLAAKFNCHIRTIQLAISEKFSYPKYQQIRRFIDALPLNPKHLTPETIAAVGQGLGGNRPATITNEIEPTLTRQKIQESQSTQLHAYNNSIIQGECQ